MKVHILATCRKLEYLDGTMMVFDSLRSGFPTWPITVHFNALSNEAHVLVREQCQKHGCDMEDTATIHHQWIENLVHDEDEPFVICDTDMMFWKSVEDWQLNNLTMTGRFTPQWRDEFTKCITRARLHTSLLFFDPVMVREEIADWLRRFPVTPFNPPANLFYPLYMPWRGEGYFYDTCSMLYHAIGGQSFTTEQMECFDHMNFGTIPDIVLPHLKDGPDMSIARAKAFKYHGHARGAWRWQDKYYEERKA